MRRRTVEDGADAPHTILHLAHQNVDAAACVQILVYGETLMIELKARESIGIDTHQALLPGDTRTDSELRKARTNEPHEGGDVREADLDSHATANKHLYVVSDGGRSDKRGRWEGMQRQTRLLKKFPSYVLSCAELSDEDRGADAWGIRRWVWWWWWWEVGWMTLGVGGGVMC